MGRFITGNSQFQTASTFLRIYIS